MGTCAKSIKTQCVLVCSWLPCLLLLPGSVADILGPCPPHLLPRELLHNHCLALPAGNPLFCSLALWLTSLDLVRRIYYHVNHCVFTDLRCQLAIPSSSSFSLILILVLMLMLMLICQHSHSAQMISDDLKC